MIWNIPIESLKERYSYDWNQWFPREFDALGVKYKTIYPGPLSNEIRQGEFLDCIGTNYFKSEQLADVCRHFYLSDVKDGDVFFFQDLWFPGLEMLAYIRDTMGLRFKITGILHAGTYDPQDFLAQKGLGYWGKDLENSWLKLVDDIFVATDYHKRLLTLTREADPRKVHITGLPIYWGIGHVPWDKKEDIIVFPHRLAPEKQPDMFEVLERELGRCPAFDNWLFIKSKDVCKTKGDFYILLGKSKVAVSFALQETWGIAQQEALFAGCIPFCPDRLSYRELYPRSLRYQTVGELASKIQNLVERHLWANFVLDVDNCKKALIERGRKAIPNIVQYLVR
jgi:hypothetical protein